MLSPCTIPQMAGEQFLVSTLSSVIKAGESLKSAVAPLSCIKMTLYVFTWSV